MLTKTTPIPVSWQTGICSRLAIFAFVTRISKAFFARGDFSRSLAARSLSRMSGSRSQDALMASFFTAAVISEFCMVFIMLLIGLLFYQTGFDLFIKQAWDINLHVETLFL